MRFPNAAKGIEKIYLAEVLTILAAVLSIGILMMAAVNEVDLYGSADKLTEVLLSSGNYALFVVCVSAIVLLLTAGQVLTLWGIVGAAKDEGRLRRAVWAIVPGSALMIAGALLQNAGNKSAGWLSILSTICTMAVALCVLRGIGAIADSVGRSDVSAMGRRCRVYVACVLVLSAAARLFAALFPGDPRLASACGIGAFLTDIVACVLYMRVLYQAARYALNASGRRRMASAKAAYR